MQLMKTGRIGDSLQWRSFDDWDEYLAYESNYTKSFDETSLFSSKSFDAVASERFVLRACPGTMKSVLRLVRVRGRSYFLELVILVIIITDSSLLLICVHQSTENAL